MHLSIEQLFDLERNRKNIILTQPIKNQQFTRINMEWDMLRADLIHPICSGNKFFKLKYYILDAIDKQMGIIRTYGGAWSNHIVATAYLANQCGLQSIGVIRGEEPPQWSSTLKQAQEYGMQLIFVPRAEFSSYQQQYYSEAIYEIPQGGVGLLGVKGAAEMALYCNFEQYTHIICACGTGTMLAGLVHASQNHQQCIGIPVLKHPELVQEIRVLLKDVHPKNNFNLLYDYHWGGYAKKNQQLLDYMNDFYNRTTIPTDIIYTSKMVYAIEDLLKNNYFKPGSKILSIHSGGIQGNNSLKKGTLFF